MTLYVNLHWTGKNYVDRKVDWQEGKCPISTIIKIKTSIFYYSIILKSKEQFKYKHFMVASMVAKKAKCSSYHVLAYVIASV